MEQDNGFITIISVIIVALLGFISNIILFKTSQKSSYKEKIVEQYFKVREEVCLKICNIASLRTSKGYTPEETEVLVDEVSSLYFKHYDFLPKEVLDQLLCLYACLKDKDSNIYVVKNNELTIINNTKEIEEYVNTITLMNNTKEFLKYQLINAEKTKRKPITINLQARRVLYIMNECFSISNLLKWEKYLRKAHMKSMIEN